MITRREIAKAAYYIGMSIKRKFTKDLKKKGPDVTLRLNRQAKNIFSLNGLIMKPMVTL